MKLHRSRSRLYKKLENKSKKNLLFNLIGIVVITVLLLNFGIPMITNFILFVSGARNSDHDNVKENSLSFISSPVLNPLPTATNSAQVLVSGVASSNQTVSLYLNNIMIDQTKTENNGDFSFLVTLVEEENAIKAKAIDLSTSSKQKESDFSKALRISYKNSPPLLNIDNPADGDTFSGEQKTITIEGKTDALVKVTVNGYWAITDQSNRFSYILSLKDGENIIKIEAVDNASNKTEKQIKVTYNP